MTYFYSKTTSGFYVDTIHKTIPEDAVEITDELWQSLLNDQSNGKTIVGDENGNPITITPEVTPPTPPTKEELQAQLNKIAAQIAAMS